MSCNKHVSNSMIVTASECDCCFVDPHDYSLIHNLGYQTQEAVKQELKMCGRTGPLPWANLFFLRSMPYIRLTSFVTVPVAHLILSGLMSTLLSYALLRKHHTPDHPITFSDEQRKAVQVCWPRVSD